MKGKSNNECPVAINGRYRSVQKPTGVQIWSDEVVTSLALLVNVEILIPPRWLSKGFLGHFWEQIILPFRAWNYDVLFSPANFGPLFIKNQVVAIHDLMPVTNPELFRKSYVMMTRFYLKMVLRSKILMLTTSDSVNFQLREYLQTDTAVIKTVGMGTRELVNSAIPKVGPQNNYFVAFGGGNARKNTDFLVSFWPSLKSQENLELIIFIREKDSVHTQQIMPQSQGVEYLTVDNDEQLANILSDATCLLWPSICEGFGMPLLECMQLGVPFISSSTGAASDLLVGENKVLPLEEDCWRTEIIEISRMKITNQIDKKVLKAKASEYTWRKVAINIHEIIATYF